MTNQLRAIDRRTDRDHHHYHHHSSGNCYSWTGVQKSGTLLEARNATETEKVCR